jgi:hypothetical protein
LNTFSITASKKQREEAEHQRRDAATMRREDAAMRQRNKARRKAVKREDVNQAAFRVVRESAEE